MKEMKNIKFILLILLSFSTIFSCIDEDNDELTGTKVEGGLLNIKSKAISYVVGDNKTYAASGNIYQGKVQTKMVEVYKKFTNSVTGDESNEVLFATLPITNTTISETVDFSQDFTYADLISGLTVGGAPMSASDTDLNIGDYWTLRYVATTADGNVRPNTVTTKVLVGTRFAGTYKVIASDYWRIGVQSGIANWVGEERIIESVDATTYRHLGVGPFDPDEITGAFNEPIEEAHVYFSLATDDTIDYENVGNTTWLGQPYMTCVNNPTQFTNVPCGATTNYVVKDDVDGKDLIYMTYGYLTPGSGPREFYEVLEKVVE